MYVQRKQALIGGAEKHLAHRPWGVHEVAKKMHAVYVHQKQALTGGAEKHLAHRPWEVYEADQEMHIK